MRAMHVPVSHRLAWTERGANCCCCCCCDEEEDRRGGAEEEEAADGVLVHARTASVRFTPPNSVHGVAM